MKFLLMIIFSIVTTGAIASAENLKIEHIDYPKNSKEELHLYLSDGRVGRLMKETTELISLAQDALYTDTEVQIDLDKQHRIISIQRKSDESRRTFEEFENQIRTSKYDPTILPNMGAADTIFKNMNRGWQRESQCYNRAHIWNYEEYKRSGLLSKKVFIFFTRRYIRNYNFYWWFHAVPTVLVNHNGEVVERALDPRYVKSPLPMKMWSDVFIRSKKQCPVVTKYSTYINNQESEDCYLHFSSMFYWQPRDLDKFERTGYEKQSFIESEVSHAYWEAF